MSNLVLYSIPAFLALIVLEVMWARRHPEAAGYERRDTVASLSMGVANVAVSAGAKLLSIPFYALLYQHRVLDLGHADLAWSWLVLLVAEDFCYYWFHRCHHEVRLLWAVHVNHHSSQHYNLSTALRQALLTPITGPIFWAPLALVGFPPWMILTAQAWSLLYQFWLHTEAIGTLGPLEYVFNTPSHHRVHHGKNVRYLDRNHGGIFIVWDRLFGTFEAEGERVVYGLTKDIETFNLIRISFHELTAIAADVRRAPTLRAKLGYVFAPPGWSHDGSTLTAGELHRQLKSSST
ncbi:MAG TPA: sterol desaturase family protein [Kofleriaceae bacterium]|nr:sterol desaturase family protein [Kofleriaceae bacterium]